MRMKISKNSTLDRASRRESTYKKGQAQMKNKNKELKSHVRNSYNILN